MSEPTSFDHQPDPEIGALIRATLDGTDSARFVTRLGQVARAAGSETSLDVLSRWAPAGLVAAGIAAALVWFLVQVPPNALGNGTVLTSTPAQMDLAPAQPETDVLVVSLLEGR
ncbi:MAG TPA: hypothetical protein VLL51_10240 [Gemmatimonadales bacterium]|nr:hypothetical protein [Gemmatimonadales bacterium]